MINSYTSTNKNVTLANTHAPRRNSNKVAATISAIVMTVVVLGSLVLGVAAANNDAGSLAQSFTQVTAVNAQANNK